MKGSSGSCRTGATILYVSICLLASVACGESINLTNGVPVSGIFGTAGSERFYSVVLPEEQDELVVSISGGFGDCDLYVRRDAKPTTTAYDYRPYKPGNDESVIVESPQAGLWYIMLRGFVAYSGVTLEVRHSSSATAIPLTSGVAIEAISGEVDSERFYQITVPEGQPMLEIGIAGGTGDCDLYVRKDALPTLALYDYRPFLLGNDESVIINDPAPGTWYIMLKGCRAYADLTLLAVASRGLVNGAAYAAVTIAGEGSLRLTTPNANGWSPYINNRDTRIPYDTNIAAGPWPAIVAEGLVAGKVASESESHQMEWMLDYFSSLTTTITADFTVSLHLFAGNAGDLAYATYGAKLELLSWCGTLIDSDEVQLAPLEVVDGAEYADFIPVSLSVMTPDRIIDGVNNSIVRLSAYAEVEAITLTVPDEDEKDDGAIALANGVLLGGLTGEADSETYYKIDVPAKHAKLEISTAGGTGDVDLYVRRDVKPTTREWDARSYLVGNEETVVIKNPKAGTYYILLRGSETYADATLMAVFRDAK